MIYTGGNSIVGAYTNGVSVKEIYANGVKVWPVEEPPTPEYYITWTPSDLSTGTFTIEGSTYNFADYNGTFSFYGGTITDSAFEGAEITTIDTNAEYIDQFAFRNCSSLVSANLPNVISLNPMDIFKDCGSLRSISLPVCESVGRGALYTCYSLESINLPKCNYIGEWAFERCNLSVIMLGNSSVCRLEHSSAFLGTKITSHTGSIIVPLSLLDDYRTDSVWSYFFNVIYPDNPISEYYIKWYPKNLTGSFTIGGERRWLQNYSGYYSGPFISSFFNSIYYPMIDRNAFESTGITYVETNIPLISVSAFKYCSSLASIRMSKVIHTFGGGVFRNCTSLGYVELPALTFLSNGTFGDCTNLYEVSLPNCEGIGLDDTAFGNCYNLGSVYLPKCKVLDDYAMAFNGLSVIDLPVCSSIGTHAFQGCSSLHTLILRSTAVVKYPGTSTFSGTKITWTSGSIYVPLSLVSSYKDKWNFYSNIIKAIPNS